MKEVGKILLFLIIVFSIGSLLIIFLGLAADYGRFTSTTGIIALAFSIFLFYKISKSLYKKMFAKEIDEKHRVLKDISDRGFDDWRLYIGGGSHMFFNLKARKFILLHADDSLEPYDFSSVAGVRFDAQQDGIKQIIISLTSLERPAIRIKKDSVRDTEDTFEKLRVIFYDGAGAADSDNS